MKKIALSAFALALLASCARAQSPASTWGTPTALGKPHPSLPAPRIPDSLGVNIHFTDEKPGEAKMIADGGFRVVRMDFGWGGTEKQKGVYDWAAYDKLLATMQANKLKPYWILDYGNALYAPTSKGHPFTEDADTPEFRDAYAKWAAAAAAHFKGKGIIWEIWNEPNIAGFWKPGPNAQVYARLAAAATKAIKAAAPGECVIGPGTSGVDLEFLETCFKAGLLQHWDAVSVHPYRQVGPEGANADYSKLRRLIEMHKPAGKNIPILSGEWGYSAGWNNFDENLQGKYLPRQWLTNQVNRLPVSIWYDWHDDGVDPKEPEHHFGTVRHKYLQGAAAPYEPKPAYTAAKTLSQQLDGFTFSKRLWTGREDEWVLLFTRGPADSPQVKIAAWLSEATTASKPVISARTLAIPASSGAFSAVDYLGAAKPGLKAEKNKLVFAVADTVAYFTPRAPNALLARAAKWESVPLEQWVQAPHQLVTRGFVPEQRGVLNGATAQGGTPDSATTLLRDAEPVPVVARDTIDKGLSFAQSSLVAVANPLQVLAGPGATPGAMQIRLVSMSGVAEKGSVRVQVEGQKETTLPYEIAEGAKETTVAVPGTVKDGTRVTIVALDEKGRPSVREKRLRLVALDSFSREGAADDYAVLPDGDAKISSTQSLALAEAPEPLGGQVIQALKLEYSWDEGWKFLRVLPPATLKLDGRPKALQMWVYGDGSGNLLRLRVRDESGQTFQANGEPQEVTWKGWKQVSFALDGRGAGHWGGSDDGIIHGALAWDSVLLLDSAGRQASKGQLFLANPTLVYEDQPTPLRP